MMLCEGSVWREKRRGKGERLHDPGTRGDEHGIGWGTWNLAEEPEKAYDPKVSLCSHKSWDLTKEVGSLGEWTPHVRFRASGQQRSRVVWTCWVCEASRTFQQRDSNLQASRNSIWSRQRNELATLRTSELQDSDIKKHENLPFRTTGIGPEGIF